ncbi:MAG: pseudouridine synthase [Cytophagaceae bacterium]
MEQYSFITYFPDSILQAHPVPERFTFPFYYEPHPLTQYAASDLQNYLTHHLPVHHNFGLEENQEGMVIGKMFGVLVVRDPDGRIGYLSAFSGKLANSNQHERFVPPVFDMLTEDSFFLKGIVELNQINAEVEKLEQEENYTSLFDQLEEIKSQSESEIRQAKFLIKENKDKRKAKRVELRKILSDIDFEIAEYELIQQSLYDKRVLRDLTLFYENEVKRIELEIEPLQNRIDELKQSRKEKSNALQQQLFDEYYFLNVHQEKKSVGEIFKSTVLGKPPAGAGECATPKLLQFAFLHGYYPLAMAEFWWGASPKSEVRQHQQYYPACSGKCEPILRHMLQDIPVEENPLLHNPGADKKYTVVYEDDEMIVVNKPSGLLSVPGINIHDSVYSRLKQLWYPTEPLIVHRLDMLTSGLLVVAKTKESHKHLQRQFIKRTTVKRYSAVLTKVLDKDSGEIDLPLCLNIEDRPRHMVSFEHGKKAVTRWEVLKRSKDETLVHFWPLTGRTHQLRVHAAHTLGLNAPIKGDSLYGTTADRLYLHAGLLILQHPVTKERLEFVAEEPF